MLCNLFANRDYLEKFSALQKIWKSDVQLLPIYHDEWSNPLYTFDSFHVSWLFVFDSVTASLMDAALETRRLERLLDVRVSLNATQTGVIEMKVRSQSRRYTNSCGEMTGPQTVPNMSCRPADLSNNKRQTAHKVFSSHFLLCFAFIPLSFIKWVTLYLGLSSDK